ncbi:hypothetical protein L226DRAFT_57953 [Lentinus tigrinus ALCF2SS1-7]|uniref:Uncharacterized protein n=1 Tax=Lentinus tigrinus ALCF2SS1-6 TaxID=1328759 RepID=A0A5C2SBK3_9APHY|nr:hypothetical protein L227DRAFT_77532 [Lentinus tigrinus ALCF2SS1-6]RPD75220.1 hypothetical protein L226DRAFT_57953 [Lentinus tigrinus ALCF2SS1-7]
MSRWLCWDGKSGHFAFHVGTVREYRMLFGTSAVMARLGLAHQRGTYGGDAAPSQATQYCQKQINAPPAPLAMTTSAAGRPVHFSPPEPGDTLPLAGFERTVVTSAFWAPCSISISHDLSGTFRFAIRDTAEKPR